MAGDPIIDPLQDKIPRRLATPVALVRANELSTVRLMHDPKDTNYSRWFETSPDKEPRAKQHVPLVRSGNEVMYLVDGQTAFREMVATIKSTQDENHFVYLLNWSIDDQFEMIPGDASTTVEKLLAAASAKGVQVRAMFWDQVVGFFARFFGTNPDAVKRINALPNGSAILDGRNFPMGSHHQKILIVNGSNGLVAFCGGMDINPNRIQPAKEPGGPMHDVHCRIRGSAASSLLNIFHQRWGDHPNGGRLASISLSVPSPNGKQIVQIGRTYPNGGRHPTGGVVYNFAPFGEQSARRMVLKAIRAARRFIYIEDQYLVSMEVSDALRAALPNIQHLTILIPHGSLSDLPQVHFRRQQFIAPLRMAGGAKVGVFHLAPPGNWGTSVHSKLYIMDDEFAIIGSMNCNRRGLTHDSEVMAGIFDESDSETHPTWHFAHRLRVRLWAKHLGMTNEHHELADGVASVVHWRSPPPRAVIAPYNENQNIELLHSDDTWNQLIDPDGS